MPSSTTSDRPPGVVREPSISTRFRQYWVRHRTLFWTLHSLWALGIGVSVILLANERYGFIPWLVLSVIVAWASTLFFGRQFVPGEDMAGEARVPGLKTEVTSYLTRVIYQETLFFLLPFYWYSTVVQSANVAFTVLLVGLAVFSCFELVFDRWLRNRPLFSLVFFATAAFAAINLLLPVLLPVDPEIGTPLAALAAVGSSIPLAMRGSVANLREKVGLGILAATFLALAVGLPRLVPPVPLRLQSAVFTSGIDRETLVPADTLGSVTAHEELQGRMFILVQVFAPSNLPAIVHLEWKRGGEVFRSSREIEITAHEIGFRVWDGFRADDGEVPPGEYKITLWSSGRRVFGIATITLTEG